MGWKSRIFSFGGKIILLKHFLNSMPIHMISVMNLTKGVIKGLTRIFSTFLWGSNDRKKKRNWVFRSLICLQLEEGGLGIRDLMEIQVSLLMKFA